MLDLFSIFSKGGIVLWCFQNTGHIFTPSVNALISNVVLQERTGNNSFEHNSLVLKYKLDNEFELVFVVAYQKILQLAYIDKFLDDIQLEFRDKYKNELHRSMHSHSFDSFQKHFKAVLKSAEEWGKAQECIQKPMRTYQESAKSKKTVSSMVEKKSENKENKKKASSIEAPANKESSKPNTLPVNGVNDDIISQNRAKFAQKLGSPNAKKAKTTKSPKENTKEGKKPRKWDLGGGSSDLQYLDYTKDKGENKNESEYNFSTNTEIVGKMKGSIRDLEVEEESEVDEEFETAAERKKKAEAKSRGVFSVFQGLVGNKNCTPEMMEPVLEKLKDHLISKNVATEIAQNLCDSVSKQLEGKVLGTFESVTSIVKNTMNESLVRILLPQKKVDILRDIMEAKKQGRPYVIAFCGVNGVGKSTNLAKITFWLIENNFQVLIAACDTFRAGAVEQLRTHMRHLNSLHPPSKHKGLEMVKLYEKGYGKDAAGIAMEAINHAKDVKVDVVLIDTAGRMQDNEPLMKALSKLIKVNDPDMVLFVGEALVGNEAVDQLKKFNQAIADNSDSANPHLIDGIVLTKFDTIDDKVGAAISMTYITGKPIVFVGTGQTYTDLKSLNAKAVVSALMK
ncbi:signal recognition particle receptor subunit alpha homolog [Planococcus citri]|uniref:signal recognition particle receptor subunit alpha homolog n=1 Tax=Planococcus citri TaxID=170843 RepID=UPI0031F76C29